MKPTRFFVVLLGLAAFGYGIAVGYGLTPRETPTGALPQCERPAITPPVEAVFFIPTGRS